MRGLLRPKKDSMSVFEDERRSTLTPALSLREREKSGTVHWVTLTPTLSLREREKGKPALDLSPLPGERVRVRGDNA